MTETRFACDMTALSAEQRVTHGHRVRVLFGAVLQVEELPAGYAFVLPSTSTLLNQAGSFLALERLCCPFFNFAVELPARASSFRLVVTGEAGIKPFIRAEFTSALAGGIGFE